MSIREATARYVAARKELIDAAKALRVEIISDSQAVVKEHDNAAAKRRTWKEADEMALMVQAFHRTNPRMTQARIGAEFGIKRDLVSYYLTNPKHAPTQNAAR